MTISAIGKMAMPGFTTYSASKFALEGFQQGIRFENLYINMSTYELKINDELIDIPPKELELLYFIASSPNQVFTREQLLDHIC